MALPIWANTISENTKKAAKTYPEVFIFCFLSFGIFGFLFFMFSLFYPMFKLKKNKDFLYGVFFIIIFIPGYFYKSF